MQKKPVRWNDDAPVRVFAELDEKAWPNRDASLPGGFVETGTWGTQRTLTGGGLPGSARGGTSLSVGSGSATLPQARDGRVSPFGSRLVRAGGGCRLWAYSGGAQPEPVAFDALTGQAFLDAFETRIARPDAGFAHMSSEARLPLGSMTTHSVSGAAGSSDVSMSIAETVPGMQRKFAANLAAPSASATFDASYVIAAAAKLAGFRPSLLPTDRNGDWSFLAASSYMLQVPLVGAAIPTIGALTSASAPSWSNLNGSQWYSGGTLTFQNTGDIATEFGSGMNTSSRSLYVLLEVTGAGATIASQDVSFTITPRTVTMTIGANSLSVSAQGKQAFDGRVDISGWVSNGSAYLSAGGFTPEAGEWGVSNTATGWPTFVSQRPSSVITVTPARGGFVRDVLSMTGSSHSGLLDIYMFQSSNTKIEYANAPLTGIFNLAGRTCWEVIQEIAKSTMGAAWIDETGALVYRSRESLRGGAPVERVNADEQLEDVPWTITDDESADRVVVSYTPATIATSATSGLTLWESTQPVFVPAWGTKTITQDVEAAADAVAAFSAVWSDAGDPSGLKGSKWAAAPNRDGTGTRPANDAISISGKMLTPFRLQLTIVNNTGSTLWLVDGNGNPFIVARTSRQVTAGEPETVEWGAAEDASLSEFRFDAGQWVQDSTTANEMLTWLVSQFQAQQPTLDQVKVKPDLARQLGDIIVLTEEKRSEEHKPLKSKGLVTGISLSGSAGEITQTLDVALLTDVFRDFDSWCQANSVETFDQLDSALSAANVNTLDDFDRWAAPTLVDY